VSAYDTHKSIVVDYETSFLIKFVSGSTVDCKTAYSVGMEDGDTFEDWYLADFSSDAVSVLCFVYTRSTFTLLRNI